MKLIAVDKTGSSVCLLDPETLQVLKRLPMPLASHDIAISANGKRAYISIYGDGVYGDNPNPGHELVVLDLDSFVPRGSIDISPYTSPHGLAFDSRGILWVACDAHARLLGIFPETGSILHVVDTQSTGSHWVLASPATGDLYTSNKDELFLSVIDPERARLKATIAVPHGAEAICFSPDGKLLYAADHKRPAVLEIDACTYEIRRVIPVTGLAQNIGQAGGRPNHHMRVRVSADGATLAVAAYHFDRLVLINLLHTAEQKSVMTGKGPTALAFHPDLPIRLYFSNHDEGSIGIIDTRQGKVEQTAACNAGIEVLRFL